MRSGTVAVIGRANAGKSTLVNVMVGEKIAIVSPKPQTTRDRIMGILTREEHQIVFVDTPGIYRHRNELTDRMMHATDNASKEVDVILYVHDGHAGIKDEDISLMKKYSALGVPMLIAYTKTDIMPKENIPRDAKILYEAGIEKDVVPVSARKGRNIALLEQELVKLLKYDKEIPHGVAIVVNTFEKRENGTYAIDLDIVCEKFNHKAILIGKQGKALKEVASFARQDMEKFLGAKVFLTVYVKVREDWRDRAGLLKEFGYDKEN